MDVEEGEIESNMNMDVPHLVDKCRTLLLENVADYTKNADEINDLLDTIYHRTGRIRPTVSPDIDIKLANVVEHKASTRDEVGKQT